MIFANFFYYSCLQKDTYNLDFTFQLFFSTKLNDNIVVICNKTSKDTHNNNQATITKFGDYISVNGIIWANLTNSLWERKKEWKIYSSEW